MVDNQHKLINGYRDLSQEEISFINLIKDRETECMNMVDMIIHLEGIDTRFAAIAKTQLQLGFMALVRSIARPE